MSRDEVPNEESILLPHAKDALSRINGKSPRNNVIF